MFARAALIATLFVPAIALATPATATAAAPSVSVAAPSASSGLVVDRNPTTRVLDAAQRHTEFFTVTFQAEASEKRFVSTSLVVKDAKGTKPSELFLGVTLACAGPSGKITSSETGRNVWPAVPDFAIPVYLLLETDVAGSYTCQVDVMMCDPGDCTEPTGTGKVKIVTRKMNPKQYSYLLVSEAMPAWAQDQQIPINGDQLILSGRSATFSGAFDLSESSGGIEMGALLSITNCIEDNYPDSCAGAKKFKINGSATVQISLTAKQLPTESGVTCATASATTGTGAGKDVITWQQHHGVADVWIPAFTLSDAPGCGTSVQVQVQVKALKGNSVVVESGDKSKWSSLVYAIPTGSVR